VLKKADMNDYYHIYHFPFLQSFLSYLAEISAILVTSVPLRGVREVIQLTVGEFTCSHCSHHKFTLTQKRFIYRLLTRHDSLPVWLVADQYLAWRRKIMYRTDCCAAHPVLLNRLSKVNTCTSCGLGRQIFIY
jgi:hypothetical protein